VSRQAAAREWRAAKVKAEAKAEAALASSGCAPRATVDSWRPFSFVTANGEVAQARRQRLLAEAAAARARECTFRPATTAEVAAAAAAAAAAEAKKAQRRKAVRAPSSARKADESKRSAADVYSIDLPLPSPPAVRR